jgi:hypothetical protein
VEDGAVHARQGPSNRRSQGHAAVQPAVAGRDQERRRWSQEIRQTVNKKTWMDNIYSRGVFDEPDDVNQLTVKVYSRILKRCLFSAFY